MGQRLSIATMVLDLAGIHMIKGGRMTVVTEMATETVTGMVTETATAAAIEPGSVEAVFLFDGAA
jgi:hypothetical protein